MWTFIKKIIRTGIKTENFSPPEDDAVKSVGKALEKNIAKHFGRALAIRLVDAGSCNACELEINAACNPFYNLERYGIHFTASPRHADLLLVTGPVTKNMREALIKTYEAMPEPKRVVAVGDCARCGGVFKNSYAVENGTLDIIPVDVIVPGCPPTPAQIMQGIFKAVKT
jgi:Ni,Fe-hydrogenase III small subunit